MSKKKTCFLISPIADKENGTWYPWDQVRRHLVKEVAEKRDYTVARARGMSPMDAILTATRNSAKALGRLNDMGTIEEGKIADLIIVDGNPLKDIKVLQDLNRIKVVVKEGKIEVDRR